MFRYTIAEEAEQARMEAEVDWFFERYPEWEDMSVEPEDRRFLSERDFPLSEDEAISDEDWQFFIEATFVDPAERE